jgi:hypothetical protein
MKTSDIYYAAYVSALGIPMQCTEKVKDGNKEKTIFCYDVPEEDEKKYKSDFFGGTGDVKALQYMYALRSLKSLCFM